MDTEFVELRGQKTRLAELGSGDPVVVLHGWGGRIESMTPTINCLARHYRVVAVDLPGFGDAPVPQGAWTTADYAIFIRDLLQGRGVERAHFVGHSFGAKVSLYLAATHQHAVDKLVLVGSSGLRSAPSLRTRIKRSASRAARAAGYLGPPGRVLRDSIYSRIASQDYRDAGPLRPILVRVVNEDFAYLLPRIKASTLLVWGSRDDAVPLAHARQMEKSIPDAGLVVFEGAGHFAYLDEPDRFCRIVRHFFAPPN
ncbi:MAG TPA: alpha/beta hydrolase [Actinomycetota bacterium]|nr:alpha/beta hydrolase [Actinomycetota bacterium]